MKNPYVKSKTSTFILICFTVLPGFYSSNAIGANTTSFQSIISGNFVKESNLTSNLGKYRPLSDCKTTEEQLFDSPSNEFRTGIKNLNSNFPIKVLVFNIDFDDRISKTKNTFEFRYLSDRISSFYNAMSHGKFKFGWIYSEKPARMSKTLQSYNGGARSNLAEMASIIRDAQVLAFQEYSRKDFDYLIVVPPSTVGSGEISTTLSILHRENELINSTILAADFWISGQSWTIPAHEIGHALGLLDLYSYVSAEHVSAHASPFRTQFQFMDFYDLMNWPTGSAPELTAWNRWQLGFLGSEEIRCLPETFTETKLEALESGVKGVKALLYKVNDFQVIVIENRQPYGFDRALPSSAIGVIVYLVNLREESGNGPQRLLRPIPKAKESTYPCLHPRQEVEISGIRIRHVSTVNSRAVVQVAFIQHYRSRI